LLCFNICLYFKYIDDNKNKGGYISHIGHRPYDSVPDHPLCFRSMHSSFIKPSYNIHYRNVMKYSFAYSKNNLSPYSTMKSETNKVVEVKNADEKGKRKKKKKSKRKWSAQKK